MKRLNHRWRLLGSAPAVPSQNRRAWEKKVCKHCGVECLTSGSPKRTIYTLKDKRRRVMSQDNVPCWKVTAIIAEWKRIENTTKSYKAIRKAMGG